MSVTQTFKITRHFSQLCSCSSNNNNDNNNNDVATTGTDDVTATAYCIVLEGFAVFVYCGFSVEAILHYSMLKIVHEIQIFNSCAFLASYNAPTPAHVIHTHTHVHTHVPR